MEPPAGKQPNPEPEPHPEHLHVEEIVLEEQPPPLHPQEAAWREKQKKVQFAVDVVEYLIHKEITREVDVKLEEKKRFIVVETVQKVVRTLPPELLQHDECILQQVVKEVVEEEVLEQVALQVAPPGPPPGGPGPSDPPPPTGPRTIPPTGPRTIPPTGPPAIPPGTGPPAIP